MLSRQRHSPMALSLLLLLIGLLDHGTSVAQARPTQIPLLITENSFDPLQHLSGISPYWSPNATANLLPEHCEVTVAAYYIRHSSIYANDDEFEETIGHFQQKLHKFRHTKKGRKQLSKASPLSFMAHWSSLINETSMERITPSGGQDALELGRRFAKRYPGLLPQKTESLEIFTADAERDIKSSRAFIKGLVPRHHGGDGSGDGHVKLKKVPTHDPKWSVNLTPHKICDSWSKKNGRSQRQQWEAIFTQPIIHRFNQLLPAFDFTTADVVAMFQLCGYDTVATGSNSLFCDLFTKQEFLDFEYSNDLHYFHMLGSGSKVGPFLGMPWLETATNKLLHPPHQVSISETDGGLPPPSNPPTDTQSQRLWTYLTHREEPPTVLVALGLFDSEDALPADHVPVESSRSWWTSRIMPFLGHVGLERLHCADSPDSVRLIVNESPVSIPGCQDGKGGTCPLKDFEDLIESRKKIYHDFETGCRKD